MVYGCREAARGMAPVGTAGRLIPIGPHFEANAGWLGNLAGSYAVAAPLGAVTVWTAGANPARWSQHTAPSESPPAVATAVAVARSAALIASILPIGV